jgi:small-conductance mechanosensitive channel
MNDILSQVYFNNTVQDYLIALAIIVGGILIIRIFKKTVVRQLKKWAGRSKSTLDNFAINTLEKFALPAISLVVVYFGINYLALSDTVEKVLKIAVAVVVTFFLLRLISTLVLHGLQSYVRRQDHGEEKVKQLGGLMLILNGIIWIVGAIFLFDNLGYDVGTVIAGLGIGGIAIALAAQNILGDLFNYFVIFFDRPFEIGDFIILDDKLGTVEYIGIKTTRIKSLTGEQLIVSNSDLTTSRVHNYKRMERRRIQFNITVTYPNSLENIRMIPEIIKDAIRSTKGLTLDRSHFKGYIDSSLNFETIYFVESPDYNVYMDLNQAMYLKIYEEFEKRNIVFAYPTRTIFMAPTDKENHEERFVTENN